MEGGVPKTNGSGLPASRGGKGSSACEDITDKSGRPGGLLSVLESICTCVCGRVVAEVELKRLNTSVPTGGSRADILAV